MKRKALIILLCLETLVILLGCFTLWNMNRQTPLFDQKPAMYIDPVQDRTSRSESFQQSYDFRMTEELRSVKLEVWELKDGAWECFGGGTLGASARDGRFTLAFNELTESVTYALQSESFTYSIGKSFAKPDDYAQDSVLYTTMQTQLTEIRYDELIPLALQIYTMNQDTQFIGVDFFHQPGLLAAEGHEQIIAATLTFSKTPME